MENEKPSNLFFRFEDLRVYNKAIEYVGWVYTNSQYFPDNQKHGLTAKFMGAAQLIPIYIAEGSSRNKTQLIHYLKLAKTCIRECLVLSTICHKLSFISESSLTESRSFLIEMTKMIGAMVSSLQKTDRPWDKKDGNRIDGYQKDEDVKDDYIEDHLPLDPLLV